MYNNWLAHCTEQQLLVFIDESVKTLVDGQEQAPLWAMEQEELIIRAMEKTTRFGVTRTEPAFNEWFKKALRGLSKEDHLTTLREMPWNERVN